MPQLSINYAALRHNLENIVRLSEEWDFRWLPVMKMVANYPPILKLLKEYRFDKFGTADVFDCFCFGKTLQPEQNVYINIALPNYAEEIVRNFCRSAVSTQESIVLLDNAAKKLQKKHEVLLMLDIGDGREGVPLHSEFYELLQFLKKADLEYVRIAGVGVTLGCLNGLCPDNSIMSNLAGILPEIRQFIRADEAVLSLGGSIFWNWFAQNHVFFHKLLSEGWKTELRMGDPLFVGYDVYRNEDFIGAFFRKDTFEIKAQILEIHLKKPAAEGIFVANGHGDLPSSVRSDKAAVQALVDCGLLHTEIANLKPMLAGAKLINYSGNYTILDITDCSPSLKQGDFVSFSPDYWAVAKAFRIPQTIKL